MWPFRRKKNDIDLEDVKSWSKEDAKHFFLTASDEEFHVFIETCFSVKSEGNCVDMLNLLRGLDNDGLFYGIAKATKVESQFDHSKYFAAIVALVGLSLKLYMEINIWYAFIVTSVITGILLKMIARETRRRINAVYLKSLLEQVKAEREKEKAS
ncbi:hypothetical protein MHH84_10780 [Bacillus sp. FSL K6-1109]|uniref:hypothetical protein n=1 Tax=Bacillus TaxID=1386 RepID=UPI000951D007|nr:hypothetical protein [Bacillus licheniformis]MDE1403242.1 hypothetical protein [Bacillus licheniformis]MDE1457040.1 hypothetical protein [Bacillus licheniformis]OLQ50084.1 hypothetical protein BHT96_08015 [Bacillus licheniformis]PAE74071.1 hypothetical protein CHH84_01760 [Bacillus licheniformis]TWL74981.1 hypothetical protein CHCC15315_1920 [Bacillus licheniformis]